MSVILLYNPTFQGTFPANKKGNKYQKPCNKNDFQPKKEQMGFCITYVVTTCSLKIVGITYLVATTLLCYLMIRW